MKEYRLKTYFGRPIHDADTELATLRGVCEGILADGVVNIEEARAFHSWVERAASAHPVWPLTDVLNRLKRIFSDGICDEEEQRELKIIMENLCGRGPEKERGEAAQGLPLDNPAPSIEFMGREFSVTGIFAFGQRDAVLNAMIQRGASATKSAPTLRTDFLVIGAMASDQWKHEPYGRKIQRAMELKAKGARIAVISESHWRFALDAPSATTTSL
jgi:hypothetical protein